MKVAILGAGSGGASAGVELDQKGFTIRLWSRSEQTLQPFRNCGGIRYRGVLGEGLARPACMSTDLRAVIDGVDVILVCVPTLAHAAVAALLVALQTNRIPVVLNPGHTGGALEFCQIFRRARVSPPPTAEFSTLTYVARKSASDTVWTTGAAKRVRVAALPGDEEAIDLARELYGCAEPARDVLATGLSNVNMVLHPPGAILGAAWVEATGGDFTFYVQGLSDGVGRVMEALDRERRAVGAAFGHSLCSLFDEMQAIGTIEAGADPAAGLVAAVRGGTANQRLKAPDALSHRYYREDFWYGLTPFAAFAGIAGVEVPVAQALLTLAAPLIGGTPEPGRSAAAMGIEGLSRDALLARIRGDGIHA